MGKVIAEVINELVKGVSHKGRTEVINKAYWGLLSKGHNVVMLNDKYLIVDGINFQLRKKGNGLEAKVF